MVIPKTVRNVTPKTMISYKDTTFCASQVEERTCGREVTEEEKEHADKLGLPTAYGNYCDQDRK